MDDYITSLQRRIERLEAGSTHLTSMVSGVQTQIKNLKAAIAELKEVEKNNSNNNLNTQINTLKVKEEIFEKNTTTQEVELKNKESDLQKRIAVLQNNFNGCSSQVTSTLNNIKLKVKSLQKWRRGKQQWWSNFWGQLLIIVVSNFLVFLMTWYFTMYFSPSKQKVTVQETNTIIQQVQK